VAVSAFSRFSLILLLLGTGCALVSNSPESAKAAVIAHFGEDTRIAGPMTPAQLMELSTVSPADADRVRSLARDGAWIYSILVPDNKPARFADDGSLVEVIRVGAVLAVRRGRIIAQFEALP
jgi:hypothetical protein